MLIKHIYHHLYNRRYPQFIEIENMKGYTYVFLRQLDNTKLSCFTEYEDTNRTRTEGLENHVHLMDNVPKWGRSFVRQYAYHFTERIAKRLSLQYPNRVFQVSSTMEGRGSVFYGRGYRRCKIQRH